MRRRDFIALVGVALASVRDAQAQTLDRPRRVGVLMNGAAANELPRSHFETFVQSLKELGWVDGENVRIDCRWNAGEPALARTYAADLTHRAPDVILTSSTTNLIALLKVNQTIPTVFVQVADPLAQGFVPSLDHPGGNITGFTAFRTSMGGQWIEMLKQIAPEVERVLLVFNPETSPQAKVFLQSIEAAAPGFAVEITQVAVQDASDIESAIDEFARRPKGGLIIPTDTFTLMRRGLIVELAARHRLPAIYMSADFVRNGGLVYYGFDTAEQFRQAAAYVDRILKGAKPGDLPVRQPTKFALIVNLKTADALGLQVPAALLARADEVLR
jgi:putative tryptophan/tyrosine transport system substrate-binding protein